MGQENQGSALVENKPKPTDPVAKVQAELKKEARDEQRAQSNVSKLGGDFFDNLVATFYEKIQPGYDPLFTDDRFPLRDGKPWIVSRHYFFNDLLLDIFEPNELPIGDILEAKAVINAIGFKYTWIFKGETGFTPKTIFEDRLNSHIDEKTIIKPRKLVQTNVMRS